jgi:hypothetical protein
MSGSGHAGFLDRFRVVVSTRPRDDGARVDTLCLLIVRRIERPTTAPRVTAHFFVKKE